MVVDMYVITTVERNVGFLFIYRLANVALSDIYVFVSNSLDERPPTILTPLAAKGHQVGHPFPTQKEKRLIITKTFLQELW